MKEIYYCNEEGSVEKTFSPDEVSFYGSEQINLFFNGSFNEEGLKDMFEFCLKTEAEGMVTSDYFLLRFALKNVAHIYNA